MELIIEYIAPYLPYGLNGTYKLSDVINVPKHLNEKRDKLLTNDNIVFFLKYCKPYLHNLSDLTKEIENDFESDFMYFVAGDWCDIYDGAIEHIIENIGDIHIKALPLHLIEFLLSKHYDIYGLIKNNLAVDKNKL